jgi:hypothetical protein
MIRKFIILFFLFSAALFAQDTTVYIMIDEPISTLPQNFRKCNGGFKRDSEKMVPDTTGLNNANLSGSAEFGTLNLPAIIKEIGKPQITVVDLRQETHFLVNGIAISWYGQYDWADVGLSMAEVLKLEQKRMDSVRNVGCLKVIRVIKKDKSTGTITEVKDTVLNVESVRSEEELVKSLGHNYFRITVTDRRKPTFDDVDRFIGFVNKLASGTWLHFHCHAGDGRTTTFMTMYDMMQNAKQMSYDDITNRQYLIGGIDLNSDEHYPDYEKPYAYERTEFLKRFYEYCRENTDGFKTNYSSWLKQ